MWYSVEGMTMVVDLVLCRVQHIRVSAWFFRPEIDASPGQTSRDIQVWLSLNL